MIGRLLGIDHGIARIGVAVSDALGITATELTIIDRTSKVEDFAKLNQIAKRENAVAIVVGIPLFDSQTDQHTQADTVRLWIKRYQETTNLPIVEWDEQYSSEEARELSILAKRDMRAPIDDLAARVILQSYIDALSNGLTTLPPRP